MNKTKLLTIAIFILVVINVVTLYFFISSRPQERRGKRSMPREIVIEKLHFDENQIASYEKIIRLHQQKIRILDDSIRMSKNELYQLLNKDSGTNNRKDSLFLSLAHFQKQIERTHFNHFLEIKSICRSDQLEDFKQLTEELSQIFSHPKKRLPE